MISVIIPCYNHGEFIEETVYSVLQSTYKNTEIIIINDGSDDKYTTTIINELIVKHPQIKTIAISSKNVSIARNTGIQAATGEYILPLDSDDKIAPEYLEKAINILEKNKEIGLVYCEASFFGNTQKKWNLKPATTYNMLIENRIFPSAIFRKSAFLQTGGYNPKMRLGCEDWDLWLQFIEAGIKIYKIPERLFLYRKYQNIRSKQSLTIKNYIIIRRQITKYHSELYKKYFPISYLNLGFMILKNTCSQIKKSSKIRYKALLSHIRSKQFKYKLVNGLSKDQRNPKLIVSLTSFKERIQEVHLAINTMLQQTLQPDMIILWLSQEEFPDKKLPEKLIELTKYGLTIKWTEKNLKSYKKLIPALQEYPNDIIVLADDDVYYQKTWLEKLYKSYLNDPKAIHCHRAHRIRLDEHNNIMPYSQWERCVTKQYPQEIYLATGCLGILIPPMSLHEDSTNIKTFTNLAPNADDIWIWAMMTLNNTKLHIVEHNIKDLIYVNPEREFGIINGLTLYKYNFNGGNDKQIQAILNHYPQLLQKTKDRNNAQD